MTESSPPPPPSCDMTADCDRPIAYIDEKGFVYCAEHGVQRQQYRRCRKLRPFELQRILRGLPLEHY